MRLRTKFAIGIIAITLLLSGIVVGSHEFFQQQAIEEEHQEVAATADLTADQVDSMIEERQDFIGFVASQTEEEDFNRSDEVLLEITRNSRFFAAQLIDDDGTVVDFQGDITEDVRQETIGFQSEEPGVDAALEGRTVISEPQAANDRHIVVVSAPILAQDGSVQGVIAAAIFVDERSFLQSTLPLETGSQTVSIRGPNGEPIQTAERDFDDPIVATASTDSTDWTVTVERDRAGLTHRLQRLALIQAASLLVVLLTIVGFSVWQYRTNLRQTERLLGGFEEITAGNYDYRLSLSSEKEWQEISDGFGELAQGLKDREAALREREERLDVLNRVLRHNVRNEMSVIVNYADLISDFTDDEQIETAAETILESGRDLTALSNTAKQIRNAFGDADRLVEFDATEFVDRNVDPIRDEYPDVILRCAVPDDVTIAGIPTLGLALENILENACKYNDSEDPVVDVTVTDNEDGTVDLTVADNGPGIPAHEYEVLEAGEETALEHGSGLGLWLVHWVVERSRGDLSFEDNDPTGAVVTMTLASGDCADEIEITDV